MRLFLTSLTLILLSFPSMAQNTAHTLTLINFYADWCSRCKQLDPKVEAVYETIDQEKMPLIVFNMTNKDTIEKTKALAVEKDLEPALQKYGAKTGFFVIYDHNTHKVVEKITHKKNEAEIKEIFNSVINR